MNMPTIVIVEDNPDLFEILKESLTREGYQVKTANNGIDGLKLIKDTAPDLVCLDVMMPGMDGIEVCRELRADKSLRGLPIMMLTAKGDESDVVLGLGVGADDYITKPARPKELIARVRALLRQAGGAYVEERTVDAHIRSIRKKLGDKAELIQTIRGRGYCLIDEQ